MIVIFLYFYLVMNFRNNSILFLALSVSSAFSQSNVIDSLTRRLNNSAGREKIDILNQLAYELVSRDNARAMKYCDQSLSLSNKLGYEKGAALAYTYKGVYEYLSGEFSDGRSNLRNGLRLSIKANDHNNQGYALLQLGNSYLNQAVLDSSLMFYKRAHEILKDSTNPVILSKLYKNLSALYGVRGHYELQKKYLLRSLGIRELLKNQTLIANALILLASVNIREDDYETANGIFNRIEEILQANPRDLGNLNDWRHQKALYLIKERKFEDALALFDSARNYYIRNSILQKFVTLQTDLGKIFYERGEYELALKSLYEALRIAELKKYEVEILDIQMQLGWVNYNLGELNQSLVFANLALALAKKDQLPNRIADAQTLKGVAYTKLKDFSNAKSSLDQVLLIRQGLKEKSRISEALMNLGFLEESRKNYWAAKDLYRKSLELAELSKYDFGKAWSLLGLGNVNFKLKEYTQAAKFIMGAEALSKEISANEILIQVYELHRDLLAAENKLKEALQYSLFAYNLKDSLHRSDLSRQFFNLQKMDEIERRDRDINVLTKDKQLAENKINLQELKLNQQYLLIVTSSIGLILLGALAFVYARYYFRIRRLSATVNEKNISIQHQADKLAEINNRLFDQNKLIEIQKSQLLVANETLEHEVDQRTEELTKQNLQLEQFAFMTSHNLRAPVARLLGLTQLFNHENLSDPLNRQLIDKIRISSQEFDVIMRDLASILEVKNGVSGNFSVTNIEECFHKAKVTLHEELSHIQFSLSTQFDEHDVYGVEPYLTSIFYNLLSNSSKFKKEDTLNIKITSRKQDGLVILEYNDNGIGFDMREAGENLFKPYKRFHVHKVGKGLGLYMIKLQVEAMGGTVAIKSEPNAGFSCVISFKAMNTERLRVEPSLSMYVENHKN